MNRVLNKVYKKDDGTIVYVVKTFAIMLAVFFLAVVGATAIPNAWVNKNAEKSIAILRKEGNTSFAYSSQKNDGFSDNIMFSMAENHSKESMNVAAAAMDDSYISNADPSKPTKLSYAWFWHGYTVFLKPALIFFDIHVIRQLIILAFLILVAAVAYQLAKLISVYVALVFIVSLGIFNPPVIMANLEYFSDFAVMFISSIILLYMLQRNASQKAITSLFLAIGGFTIFFDFFTTPIITWGMPLLVYIAYTLKHRQPTSKKLLSSAGWFSVAWAAGYGLIWASKWTLASLILGRNVFRNVFLNTVFYTSPDGMTQSGVATLNYTLREMFRLNIDYALLFKPILLLASLVLLVVLATLVIRRQLRNGDLLVIFVLAGVSAAPFAWMVLSKTHSFIHHWMTHRDFIITTFGVLILVGFLWSRLKITGWMTIGDEKQLK